MATTLEELEVIISAKTDGLNKAINEANNKIDQLQKSGNKTGSGLAKAFAVIKTSAAVAAITKLTVSCSKLGMEAQETAGMFSSVFGQSTEDMQGWIEDVNATLGVSVQQLQRETAYIYSMSYAMGLGEQNSKTLAKSIAGMSEDLSHFYNVSSEEAYSKLQSALVGQTRGLKEWGIVLDEATIKQVAYAKGIAQSGSELTEQQKVLARYEAILMQTGAAQGSAIRELTGLTSQVTMLKNNFAQLGTTIGSALVGPLATVLSYANAVLKAINTVFSSILGIEKVSNTAESSVKSMSSGMSNDMDGANKSAKELKKQLSGFDELNVLSSQKSESDVSSSFGDFGGFEATEYDLGITDEATKKAEAMASKIQKAMNTVKEAMVTAWNYEPVQAFVGFATSSGQFIIDYWSTIGTDLYNNLANTWNNISGSLSQALSNVGTFWTSFWNDMTVGIQTYGQPIIDGVSGLFNSIWTDAIDPAIQFISQGWADFTGILVDFWNKHGKVLIDNIGQFATKTIGFFQQIWDDVLNPIVQPFLETLSWLWEEHLSGVVEKVGDFIGKLINGALEIYNQFILPIVSWVVDVLSPVWAFLSNLVVSHLGTILATISGVFGSIIGVLGGVIDFITGIFTGNWKKAWNGVKTAFKNIIDGLIEIFKFPINWIIDGINSFIAGLNKIKIPDWVPLVGGKGINIQKIPKLAEGGIIESPTLAMIGERGREAVVPLENNTEWINKVADSIESSANNSDVEDLLKELITVVKNKPTGISKRDVGKAAVEFINSQNRILGGSLV